MWWKVAETGQSFIHQFFTRSKCLLELAASSKEESGEENGDTELEEICELEKSVAVHLQKLFPEDEVGGNSNFEQLLILFEGVGGHGDEFQSIYAVLFT